MSGTPGGRHDQQQMTNANGPGSSASRQVRELLTIRLGVPGSSDQRIKIRQLDLRSRNAVHILSPPGQMKAHMLVECAGAGVAAEHPDHNPIGNAGRGHRLFEQSPADSAALILLQHVQRSDFGGP